VYDEIKKQYLDFRTSTRPALEQVLTDHELRLNPDSVPVETKFLEFSVPKGLRRLSASFCVHFS
jgi:hypothetical protein